MLIHICKGVFRFDSLIWAKLYAIMHCRGRYEFYVIVDTVENKVVDEWSY